MIKADVTALANEIELMVLTIGHLAAIAADQGGREGSEPGPQLNGNQVDAALQAAISISKDAHTKFCSLMTALKVPA